jgi:predicted transcriptional regulator
MSLHQKKEAELMELLSSIIMDYETTTEQAQGEKIQRFFSGLYKDIKPENKNIQPKKKHFFASLSTTNQVYSTNTFRPSMSRGRQHCSRSREV